MKRATAWIWLSIMLMSLALASSAAVAAPQFFAQPVFAMPGILCRAAIAQAERAGGIPGQLLAAIGRVESGRRDPNSGSFAPWPWTVNAEGQGFFFDSKAEAVAAVRRMRADGVRSIDVGCLQVNLMHHPDAFASLEAAFDPAQNAAYAAKFLNDLHALSGDWPKAAALYHSANPELGEPYLRKVLAVWPDEKQLAGRALSSGPASSSGLAWSSGLAGGSGQGLPAFGLRGTGMLPTHRSEPALGSPAPGSPAVGNPGAIPGRGLEAYRAMPIAMISRIRRIGG